MFSFSQLKNENILRFVTAVTNLKLRMFVTATIWGRLYTYFSLSELTQQFSKTLSINQNICNLDSIRHFQHFQTLRQTSFWLKSKSFNQIHNDKGRYMIMIKVDMEWLPWVGVLKLWVSCAKEPYKRDDILQKRPTILRSLLIEATPYTTKQTRYTIMVCNSFLSNVTHLYARHNSCTIASAYKHCCPGITHTCWFCRANR